MSNRVAVGDIFEVPLDSASVRFIQYIADDTTQLNSQVVRVFRECYAAGQVLDVGKIAAGEVDFYAHVLLRIGVRQKIWRKVGRAVVPSVVEVLFRNSDDYGNPSVTVSRSWYVWNINGPFEFVGELTSKYQGAEIGVVVPPDSLLYRIRNGRYDFVYPGF